MVAMDLQQNGSSSVRGRIKEQKAALIQEEILIAAARLIASRGFRAVTVDDISAEMGFTKSIVYYYMKNKNEILWRIFEKIDEPMPMGWTMRCSAVGRRWNSFRT
jgi:TetR/AcrR family transcriptional regulator, cholesterol catabolism regulator